MSRQENSTLRKASNWSDAAINSVEIKIKGIFKKLELIAY